MERDWERRYEPPLLPAAAVRAAIRAHVDQDVERTESLPGGKINAHTRVFLVGGPSVVLRVGLGEQAALPKEAAILRWFEGDLPVPRLLGQGILDPDGAAFPYLLLAWLPGRTLDDVLAGLPKEAAARAGRDTGTAMARIHAERREGLGFLDEALRVPEPMGPLAEVWAGYLTELMDKPLVAERLGDERRRNVAALIRREGELVADLEGSFALLHGDCKPTNIRVAADGSLTGLLDWEFAWSGPPLSDWGQILRWPVPAAFEEGLLEGYEQAGGGRILSGAGRRQAALLDLMNLVTFLEWSDGSTRPRRVTDALRLLDATLAAS